MNLKISVSGYAALFLELGVGGSIKNLGIENFDVTGHGTGGRSGGQQFWDHH